MFDRPSPDSNGIFSPHASELAPAKEPPFGKVLKLFVLKRHLYEYRLIQDRQRGPGHGVLDIEATREDQVFGYSAFRPPPAGRDCFYSPKHGPNSVHNAAVLRTLERLHLYVDAPVYFRHSLLRSSSGRRAPRERNCGNHCGISLQSPSYRVSACPLCTLILGSSRLSSTTPY